MDTYVYMLYEELISAPVATSEKVPLTLTRSKRQCHLFRISTYFNLLSRAIGFQHLHMIPSQHYQKQQIDVLERSF